MMTTERDYDKVDIKRWRRIGVALRKRYPDIDFDDWNGDIVDYLLDGKSSDEEIIESVRLSEVERLTNELRILTK